MAKQKFDLAKGVKDWYGEDAILRNRIRETLRSVFERYGYNPIETPILERLDTLGFKGGGEIQKEVFRLKDQGKRDLALRFDQTVPLARFVATHLDVKFPFKRYVMGEVFRDGPTQPEQGRYRSFTQCDVDVLGIKSMTAEAELLALARDAFGALGLGGVEVKINNRKLLDGILNYAGVEDSAKLRTITTLDKIDKIGEEGVEIALSDLRLVEPISLSNYLVSSIFEQYSEDGLEGVESLKSDVCSEIGVQGYNFLLREFKNLGESKTGLMNKIAGFEYVSAPILGKETVQRLMETTRTQGSNEKTVQMLSGLVTDKVGREGLQEISQLLQYSEKMGLDFVQFDPSLARGLDYYTGTTVEVYLKDRDILNSAILAGGRFDDMVGDFRGGGTEIPAVGFSFGLERLVMIVKEQSEQLPKSTTELYIVPVGTQEECLLVAQNLRRQGVNVDVEYVDRKVGQAISFANSRGIPYVGIIGGDEITEGTIMLKDLQSRNQCKVPVSEVYRRIKGDNR